MNSAATTSPRKQYNRSRATSWASFSSPTTKNDVASVSRCASANAMSPLRRLNVNVLPHSIKHGDRSDEASKVAFPTALGQFLRIFIAVVLLRLLFIAPQCNEPVNHNIAIVPDSQIATLTTTIERLSSDLLEKKTSDTQKRSREAPPSLGMERKIDAPGTDAMQQHKTSEKPKTPSTLPDENFAVVEETRSEIQANAISGIETLAVVENVAPTTASQGEKKDGAIISAQSDNSTSNRETLSLVSVQSHAKVDPEESLNKTVIEDIETIDSASVKELPPPPAYTGGAIDVIELARNHVEPSSSLTVAVCYKTMFGSIDIGLILQWVAYHRLLGFDHVFLFYRTEMELAPRFQELKSLPFVTLTTNMKGNRKSYYGQKNLEKTCLSEKKYAGSYDWAMLADIDEYLWLPGNIGIKEFLQKQEDRNLDYLSFGKYMYSLDHRTDYPEENYVLDSAILDPPFALSQYPFHMRNYCYGDRRRGEDICPVWKGRAKVIVKPAHHTWIDTHGVFYHLNINKGDLHFHPSEGHFMEWPHIFDAHNVTKREAVNFEISNEEEVHIHDVEKAFKMNENGKFTVEHDDKLTDWFHFVINRAQVSDQSLFSSF